MPQLFRSHTLKAESPLPLYEALVTDQADFDQELREAERQIGDLFWDKRRGIALTRADSPPKRTDPTSRGLLKDVESLRRRVAALEVRSAARLQPRIARVLARCDRLIEELKASERSAKA